MVIVLEVAVLAGVNEAVAPLGRPDAESATALLKPFTGLTVMVLAFVFELPCAMETLDGAALKLKLPAGTIVSEMLVWLDKVPDAPMIVTENVPTAAFAAAVNMTVLDAGSDGGLNEAVTPLGKPEAEKLTAPLNPFCGVTVMTLPPLVALCVTDKLFGEAASVKLGEGADAGQLCTRGAALMVPMPGAKSQPRFVPYARSTALFDVERTPTEPSRK